MIVATTTQSMRVSNSTNHHVRDNTTGAPAGATGTTGNARVKSQAPSPNHEKPTHPKIDPWDTNQVHEAFFLTF